MRHAPTSESGGKHISLCIISILHLKTLVEEEEGRKNTSLQNLCKAILTREVKADPTGAAEMPFPLFCKSTYRICLLGTHRVCSAGGRPSLQVFLVQGAIPKGAKLYWVLILKWAKPL